MKTKLLGYGFCFILVITVSVVFSSFAYAKKSKPVVLNFNHLFPEVSWMHQDVVVPWKKMVEEKSQGRIKVNLYPAGALAKPGTMYDAVKTGTIDMCLEPGPYYWGRFPMSEATQLPFMGAHTSRAATRAWMDLYNQFPELRKEYEDTHLLWLFSQGPGQIFSNKPIRKVDDMKGLIVRGPGAQGDFVKAVGGSPVSLPSPEAYIGLSKGTLDATTFAVEAIRTWRLYEVTQYAVVGDFYVQWFFVTMNKNKYNRMPKELQQIIDQCSGMVGAELTAKAWDAADKAAFELGKKNGMEVIKLSPEELGKWEQSCAHLTQDWISRMTNKGYPAEQFIKEAKNRINTYNAELGNWMD